MSEFVERREDNRRLERSVLTDDGFAKLSAIRGTLNINVAPRHLKNKPQVKREYKTMMSELVAIKESKQRTKVSGARKKADEAREDAREQKIHY
jgi:hypothetical protein